MKKIYTLLWIFNLSQYCFSQSNILNCELNYELKYKDTVGTFIEVIDYFTQKNIANQIYYLTNEDNILVQHQLIKNNNKFFQIDLEKEKISTLYINNTIVLNNIVLKKNCINQIFLTERNACLVVNGSLSTKSSNHISIIESKSKDTIDLVYPFSKKMNAGNYTLFKNDVTPPFSKKINLNPNHVTIIEIDTTVFTEIINYNDLKYLTISTTDNKKIIYHYKGGFYFEKFKLFPQTYKVTYQKKWNRKQIFYWKMKPNETNYISIF